MSILSRVVDELPLLRLWVARELRSRYRQSWLRAGWSVLQPAVLLATYGLVFVALLDVQGNGIPYLLFAWSGLTPFGYLQQALGQGVGSIQHAGGMISKVYFPREVLPLSIVGAGLLDLGVTTVIMVGLTAVQVGEIPITIVALPLVYVALILWTAALTVLAAAMTAFRRDLNLGMPLMMRVLFILTPVMYPISLLYDAIGPWVWLNPFAIIVEATRDTAIRGMWPDTLRFTGCLLSGLALLWISIAIVQRSEHRMADQV